MSRIGKLPISIPANVTVAVSNDNVITVKGPKGELSQKIDSSIAVVVEEGTIVVKYSNCETYAEATKQQHAFHGLYRALINNMVIGVSTGFRKELELVGVGYRVNDKPNNAIELLLGLICAKIRSFRKPEPYKGKGVKFVGEIIRRKSGKSAGAK